MICCNDYKGFLQSSVRSIERGKNYSTHLKRYYRLEIDRATKQTLRNDTVLSKQNIVYLISMQIKNQNTNDLHCNNLAATVGFCDNACCIFSWVYVSSRFMKRIATDSTLSVVRVPLYGEPTAILLIVGIIWRNIKTKPPGRISRGRIKKHAMSIDKGSETNGQQSSEKFAVSHVGICSHSMKRRVSNSTRLLRYKPYTASLNICCVNF